MQLILFLLQLCLVFLFDFEGLFHGSDLQYLIANMVEADREGVDG